MKTKILALSVLATALIFSCSPEQEESENIQDETNLELQISEQTGPYEAVDGEYIIVFTESNDRSLEYDAQVRGGSPELTRIQNVFRQKALNTLSSINRSAADLGFVYTGVLQGFHAKNLSSEDVRVLSENPEIAYIEPNYKHLPNLPRPIDTEGVREIPQDVIQQQSGQSSRDVFLNNGEFLPWGVQYVGRGNNAGTNRYCFVLDTGIAPHSDLTIDSGLSHSTFSGESWQDFNGHGTHVAGTIGGRNNGGGVIGVAYGTTLVAVKVLGGTQGTGSDANSIAGCDYAYNNSISGDVFNYSVGYRNRYTSVAVDNAFKRLDNRIYGALAAGNSNDNTLYYSPQRINTSRTWMVGNLRRNLTPNGTSNFGSSVDRWAPGTDVWSTWLNGNFNKISGTSMASPHVAGILLVRGNNSVGTQGTASKGGYTAGRAKL